MSIIVPLEGFGGGNNPLNFKVVGNPQPESPKENTIWVNTDTEITGWQFASDDPNLLDFNNWANGIGVLNGTKTVSGNAITLTSNASGDCYTDFDSRSLAVIPCIPGKTYVFEWEHSGSTGDVYLFPNASVEKLVCVEASVGKIEYTATEGVTFFTFRLGALYGNATATYSNIRITEKERAFASGMVWISTGTSSPAEFNALKKNGIMVYPTSAKQYIGGAWVEKIAKIYSGGAWIDFAMYLVQNGVDITFLTGGWQDATWGISSNDRVYPTTNFANGAMSISVTNKEAAVWGKSTKNAIDLTNVNSIVITCDATAKGSSYPDGGGAWLNLNVAPSPDASSVASLKLADKNSVSGTFTLDVSNLTGKYFIGFGAFNWVNSGLDSSIKVYSFELKG